MKTILRGRAGLCARPYGMGEKSLDDIRLVTRAACTTKRWGARPAKQKG